MAGQVSSVKIHVLSYTDAEVQVQSQNPSTLSGDGLTSGASGTAIRFPDRLLICCHTNMTGQNCQDNK